MDQSASLAAVMRWTFNRLNIDCAIFRHFWRTKCQTNSRGIERWNAFRAHLFQFELSAIDLEKCWLVWCKLCAANVSNAPAQWPDKI